MRRVLLIAVTVLSVVALMLAGNASFPWQWPLR